MKFTCSDGSFFFDNMADIYDGTIRTMEFLLQMHGLEWRNYEGEKIVGRGRHIPTNLSDEELKKAFEIEAKLCAELTEWPPDDVYRLSDPELMKN